MAMMALVPVIVVVGILGRTGASAPVLLAQAVDMLRALARLGKPVDNVLGPRRPLTRAQNSAAKRGVHASVMAEKPHRDIDSDAGDKGDSHLDAQHPREQRGRDALGEQHGQHLIGSRQEYGDQCAQRDDAARIQRRPHGRETALGEDAQNGTDYRPGGPRTLDHTVDVIARHMLE